MDPASFRLFAASAGAVYENVADVFSNTLYVGNSNARTITNQINLSGQGGLVWIKNRDSGASYALADTTRGVANLISSDSTNAATNIGNSLTAFNSNGFNLGTDAQVNISASNFVSWTFRKAAKFFDIVTYTGDGAGSKAVSHALGVKPGLVIIKRRDTAANWVICMEDSVGDYPNFYFTTAAAKVAFSGIYGTSTTFNVAAPILSGVTSAEVNASGGTYVMYLFANDAGGFGAAGTDSITKVGSYTGNGSVSGPSITLGWQPQWLLIKRSDSATNWIILDTQRVSGSSEYTLSPNNNVSESNLANFVSYSSTGFTVQTTSLALNASGGTYRYLAIRS